MMFLFMYFVVSILWSLYSSMLVVKAGDFNISGFKCLYMVVLNLVFCPLAIIIKIYEMFEEVEKEIDLKKEKIEKSNSLE